MSRFHINPSNGNPGKCSAKVGNCPFGADAPHFSTREDAQAAYEMTQGGAFGIEAPLLTANKTAIKDLIERMSPTRWTRRRYPDKNGVFGNAVQRLSTIAEIGFNTKAAREESSKQVRELAQELFDQRRSPDFDTAFAARRAYDLILDSLGEHKLEDLRDDEGKATDDFLHKYDPDEDQPGYGSYTDEELDNIERIATSVDLADLTGEDIDVAQKASYQSGVGFFTRFSSYDVIGAKQAVEIRKTVKDYDSLPSHVKIALGSKEGLEKRATELDKQAEGSVSRKAQMASFVETERRRRRINANVKRYLEEEAE